MRAPETDEQHALHLFGVKLPVQAGVGRVKNQSALVQLRNPLRQVDDGVIRKNHHGPPATGDLKEEDAEAIDVRFLIESAGDGALRVHVPHGSGEHGGVRTPAVVDQPGEPEVTELGMEGRVQHHVAGLDVPVHHALLPLLQVQKRRPESQHDLVPDRPWQQLIVVGTVEMLVRLLA